MYRISYVTRILVEGFYKRFCCFQNEACFNSGSEMPPVHRGVRQYEVLQESPSSLAPSEVSSYVSLVPRGAPTQEGSRSQGPHKDSTQEQTGRDAACLLLRKQRLLVIVPPCRLHTGNKTVLGDIRGSYKGKKGDKTYDISPEKPL